MENFEPIQDFPDYLVGDFGTIKSLKHGKERTLRPGLNRDGYLQVALSTNGATKKFYTHRLVAIHFIPNPDNLPEVNHLDGDKLNCAKSNLGWSSHKANVQHAYDTGLKVGFVGTDNPASKLTPEQVLQIRSLKGQKSYREIGLLFNVSKGQVGKIQSGNGWKIL